MNKKFIIISISVALLIVATITVSSYAYFTISNKEGEETEIKSGTMSLLFTDGNEITANSLLPGQSIEKEFTVKNTGNVNTSYDVYLSEVINTFVDKSDLVYELISEDGGYNTENPIQVPNRATKIVSEKTIGVEDTQHYKLKITFLNKNENQDDNQGKEFKATIQINEYKDIETTVNYYMDNVLVSTMPTKSGSNYVSSNCNKNARVSFDTDTWDYELININQNNTTCNIYFETPEFILTYDYNYTGSTPTTTNIKMGQVYGTLPSPERSGYDFLGWYTKQTDGELVTENTLMGSSNTTIYALWDKTVPTFIEPTSDTTHKGIVYLDPTDPTKKCESYVSTTGNKTGCMKWYIFDDSGDNYKMLLANNTTGNIVHSTNGSIPYSQSNVKSEIDKLVNDYNWQLTPDVLTAAEVANILSVDGRTVTCEQIWCDATFTAANTQASNYKFGWLFDKTSNCVENGCYTNDNNTYGWWTKNDSYRSYAIQVGRQMMGHASNNGYYGVRPYVTISKSVFEK